MTLQPYGIYSGPWAVEQRYQALLTERSSWDAQWRELADYVKPRSARFLTSDINRGEKKNYFIVDSTATRAVNTLSAGMMSGITSPARAWFQLTTPVPAMMELPGVKSWLYDVGEIMRDVYVRSNLYEVLPNTYSDLGLFGTGVIFMDEDEDEIIRFHNIPIGSYVLTTDPRGQVNGFMQVFSMTALQLIQKFGEDNVSTRVKDLCTNNNGQAWIDVLHSILPNEEYDGQKLDAKYKKWKSCYIERGAQRGINTAYSPDENKYLRESGYDEFPIAAPRWQTTGNDVYGSSPGMDALGDIKALQWLQKTKSQAIDKTVNPPLMGPTSLRNARVSLIPGDVTYVDAREGMQGLKPIHDFKFDISGCLEDIGEHHNRINDAFFVNLFLMLANDVRTQPPTAAEIHARQEEKLLMLGPVLERLNDELLDQIIDRSFAICLRRGLFPEPPPELRGMDLRVEYQSIMAQAQKSIGLGSIDRLMNFVANAFAVTKEPAVLDPINWDEAVTAASTMLGTPPKIVRTPDQVAAIRAERAQQQQAAQEAANAQAVAKSAKDLSQAEVTDTNALGQLVEATGALP